MAKIEQIRTIFGTILENDQKDALDSKDEAILNLIETGNRKRRSAAIKKCRDAIIHSLTKGKTEIAA